MHKDWRTDAACAPGSGIDPDVFFPVGEMWKDTPLDRENARQAKAVCWVCPVAAECLTSALACGDDHAIAGGMTPDERRALRRNALVA